MLLKETPVSSSGSSNNVMEYTIQIKSTCRCTLKDSSIKCHSEFEISEPYICSWKRFCKFAINMHETRLPGHVSVDHIGGVLEKNAEPGLEFWRWLTVLDAHVEEVVEVLEGVLVHGVYLSQSSHHKVHHRASGGNTTVLLSGL